MATSTTLAKNRKTPGVYITEFPAFPPSIIGVATAVPIFIGYTEKAADPVSGQQAYNQAIAIDSLASYIGYFGLGFNPAGAVLVAKEEKPPQYDFQGKYLTVVENEDKKLELQGATAYYNVSTSAEEGKVTKVPQFSLYPAMQLFYANGGGNCFVISVANYKGTEDVLDDPSRTSLPITKDPLLKGLHIAGETRGPTITVVPEACLLGGADYDEVVQKMLLQAHALQDRVAILDMPGALETASWTPEGMSDQAARFYTAIAPASDAFSYGAAYAPALESTLLSNTDVDYTNLQADDQSARVINSLLTAQALALYPMATDGTYSTKFQHIAARIAAAYPPPAGTETYGTPENIAGTFDSTGTPTQKILVSMRSETFAAPAMGNAREVQALDQYLVNALPLTGQIEQILVDQLNVVPPSGAMAGVWARNDAARGVWNAPANLSLAGIVAPKVELNDNHQGDLNVPLNGNAIDILRTKPGRGTVVWGARTLDGNSPDYRFIQVRRTLNYIEQSIKLAMQPFVFAANHGGTWVTVTAAVQTFLTQLWQAGGLMGDKAGDAFTVACGVPTTMSSNDVLSGYMIVSVTVSLIRPAEFIELTFKQTMQGA